MTNRAIAALVALVVIALPRFGHAEEPEIDSVRIATKDGVASLSLGLDGQARFGLMHEDSTWTSEFRLRRFRPIIEFTAFEQFEVIVVPELAYDPELKDGVIRWIPTKWFKAEVGQFAPPFNWQRDGSSDYHQFTERSVANREFQIADGRDIGLQFDVEWDKWLDLEVGVFNGAGSNERVEPGRGHLFSGRLAYAPLGYYHEVEVIPEAIDEFVFIAGLGGFLALDNAWRDWSAPGTSDDLAREADVWSVTADAHVWWWRLSVHAEYFYRQVTPCCGPQARDYEGQGLTLQAGVLIVPERLMIAYRYSMAKPDTSDGAMTTEVAGVVQLFLRGNRSKFTLDGGRIERDGPFGPTSTYGRLQYQILL